MSVTYGCISCLETDNLYNIYDTHECEGIEEVYANMLKICFDIDISQNAPLNFMCENCILNLRQAYYFKQNVVRNLEALETALASNIEDEVPYNFDTQIQLEEGLDPETGQITVTFTEKLLPDESLSEQCDKFEITGNEVEETATECLKEEDSINTSDLNEDKKYEVDHVQDINNDEQLEEASHFECGDCGKKFATKLAIARHMKTHLQGTFDCHLCGKEFSKLNTRNSHVWRVHGPREPYACARCPQRFPTFLQRLRHQQLEHGQTRQYPCPHCDNVYSYAGARSTHIAQTHRRVQRHHCAHCSMGFYKRRALNNHLASVHGIGEKAHVCPVCDKSFYRFPILRNHMKLHDADKILNDKKHECHICHAHFKYKTELKNHMKCHELESQGDVLQTFYVVNQNATVEC